MNFENNDEVKRQLDALPRKNIDMADKKIMAQMYELPHEIYGISNIYRPLELILMGTAFEVSALVLLDALIVELMHKLNLREKDLKAFHDVLSSAI